MAADNPNESPTAAGSNQNVAVQPKPPFVFSIGLCIFGMLFLLLLNGQVFTNALVFLACVFLSGLLWVRLLVRSVVDERRHLALKAVILHLMVLVGFSTGLPKKYRWQQRFNNSVNELREKSEKNRSKTSP